MQVKAEDGRARACHRDNDRDHSLRSGSGPSLAFAGVPRARAAWACTWRGHGTFTWAISMTKPTTVIVFSCPHCRPPSDFADVFSIKRARIKFRTGARKLLEGAPLRRTINPPPFKQRKGCGYKHLSATLNFLTLCSPARSAKKERCWGARF